jgi:catechol 2,3-dioxygenase-like lactoylglutathione lyase family enzyme
MTAERTSHDQGQPLRPTSRATTVVHVGVTVPDIELAVAWYSRVLGFDVLVAPVTVTAGQGSQGNGASDVFGARFGSMKIAQLVAANGVGIEFFQFLEPRTQNVNSGFDYWKPGPFHICVLGRDVDALADEIATTGGKQRTAVHASFAGEPYRWCYCEDPFGNIIEIYSHSHEQVYANRSFPPSPPIGQTGPRE